MRWNPYIDLRCTVSRAVRTKCKACEVEIGKGSFRAEAIPIIGRAGKFDMFHVDCVAKYAPDLAARKLKDKDPDWPAEALQVLAKYVPEGTAPSPRSYLRTPITNITWAKEGATPKPCPFCGLDCPGEPGPQQGHAIRAWSLDGERRFHPICIVQLAPGLCHRVALEGNTERWPPEVLAFFKQVAAKVPPTPRSAWQGTAGLPRLERAPSARAACRYCSEKIKKGELRLAREQMYNMRRSPVYFHVGCFCKSEDYHPKFLELVILKLEHEITREEVEALASALPPAFEEDDDVPPLLDRLLALYDAVPREQEAQVDEAPSNLTENVVEFPKGFFST